MRLLPKSLYGRLTIILLVGLLLAQVLGAAILFRDRGLTLYQASGMQSAQRIAQIVRLLEPVGRAERLRLINVLNVPPLRISLDDPPWADVVKKTTNESLATLFRDSIVHNLDEDYAVTVAINQIAPPTSDHGSMGRHRPGAMMHNMGHMQDLGILPPEGVAFLAQVQLSDSVWVTFEQQIAEEVFAWPTRVLVALGLLLLAVMALSLFAVRSATGPLSLLADAAHNLGRDIRQPPLPEGGPIEVSRALRAFNTMQARLARYIEDRTRVLTAVSHDLKTPITRLRLRAEMLEDSELRQSFIRDLDDLHAMTTATLGFLRGLEEQEKVQPVDVDALVESVKVDTEELGHIVTVSGKVEAPFPARPLALKRCITNLVDNAVKYGTRADMILKEDDDALVITVADRGPGIPEAQRTKVFEPFYRLDSSRSRDTGGTGLGLSIARNIALAHGGSLELYDRDGGGIEAVLRLPR